MTEPPTPARRPARRVSLAYLERAALAYLERYASSSQNLRRILVRKVEKRCRLRDEDPAEFMPLVDEVVRRTVSGGFVDDARYAQGRVASLRRRGGSARLIAAKLGAKGVDRALIDGALAESEADDEAAAWALARRRKLGPYRQSRRSEYRDKDMAVLARAGFGYGIAKAVVDGEIDAHDEA